MASLVSISGAQADSTGGNTCSDATGGQVYVPKGAPVPAGIVCTPAFNGPGSEQGKLAIIGLNNGPVSAGGSLLPAPPELVRWDRGQAVNHQVAVYVEDREYDHAMVNVKPRVTLADSSFRMTSVRVIGPIFGRTPSSRPGRCLLPHAR